jgi:hypothetical protein
MSNFEDLKIKFSLSIGFHGANRNDEHYLKDYVDEDSWCEMSDSDKEKFIDGMTEDWSCNYIDLSGWVE